MEAKRCWTDVDDWCHQPPVVRVVTEQFARHYCKGCFARWKKNVRTVAAALGDGRLMGTIADQFAMERLRRRSAEELAAVEEDERREKVRSGL